MRYDERLWVPGRWWVVAACFLATLWLAYVVAAGPAWAAVVTALGAAVAAAILIGYGSARVAVGGGELIAGRARVPVAAIAGVEPLSPEEARALRGPQADARAYLLIRPYVPRAVRVDIADPADPTPYWYVATRRPEALAAALQAELGISAHD